MTGEGPVPALRLPSLRKVLVALLILVLVVAGVLYYATITSDPEITGIAPVGTDPFADGQLRPGPHDAAYSPDGLRVAVLTGGRLAMAEEGDVRPITPRGSNVVDFAWFPGSNALLVAEGPVPTGGLVILEPDGTERGTLPLDPPISFGNGEGMDVAPSGREAVVTAVTRPTLGEEQRYLAHVDLETGRVRPLTDPDDTAETAPVWLDADTIAFTSETDDGSRLEVIDAAGSGRRPVALRAETVQTVGALDGEWVVVGVDSALLAVRPDGRRRALGEIPAGAAAVSVDPAGRTAIVAQTVQSASGTAVQLSTIELHPPST